MDNLRHEKLYVPGDMQTVKVRTHRPVPPINTGPASRELFGEQLRRRRHVNSERPAVALASSGTPARGGGLIKQIATNMVGGGSWFPWQVVDRPAGAVHRAIRDGGLTRR